MAAHEVNKIGLVAATVIGINAMIGAGIFAMPAKLALLVGPASVFSYMVSAVLVLFIVFALGRLAVLFPGDAWGYRYPALWGGHLVGMVSSVGYMAGVVVAMGFVTQQLGVWLAPFLPYQPVTIGIAALGLIVLLVIAGAEVSSWGQYAIAACVLVPMVVSSVICLLNAQVSFLVPFAPYGYGAVVTSLPVIIFSLLGFESIASLYRVVDNPGRNVPRAAIYSVAIVSGTYALFVLASLAAVDKTLFVGGLQQAFSQVLLQALPAYGWLSGFITVGAVFAIVGTLHSMLWSIAELFLDVSRKGRSCSIKPLVDAGWLNHATSAVFIGGATAVCAYFINANAIMVVAALPIVSAYFLSVVALLIDARTWQTLSNATIAVGAVGSSGWLCWLSIQAILTLLYT